MKDILAQIREWLDSGQEVALATVIATWGSSPREPGSGMAITREGLIAGSVSGGCVESAVIQAAQDVLDSRIPARLHFGVADAEAWEVGLACGGEIEIFIRPLLAEDLKNWEQACEAESSFVSLLTVGGEPGQLGQEYFLVEKPRSAFPEFPAGLQEELLALAGEVLGTETTRLFQPDAGAPLEIFACPVNPPLELVLVGGVQIAIALAGMAELLGYRVIVIDPRRAFSTAARFPGVRVISEWPARAFEGIQLSRFSAVVMLTHDPKIDDPAIMIALDSAAFYIGALGSRKTHHQRRERLAEAGVSAMDLDRIHAPVGLDLGGRSPEEIALAVMAEIVQTWNSRS